jgi:hypothetical protein
MGKTGSFYSKKEVDKPAKDRRYHNDTRCGPGSEIPAHNKEYGTGGYDLCEDCAKLT